MITHTEFSINLKKKGLSDNTVVAYESSVQLYYKQYPNITLKRVQAYKGYLLKHYSINTVNLRISGLNHYLLYLKEQGELPDELNQYVLPSVKLQKRTFLDNIITQEDYESFKEHLKEDQNYFWYFIIRFMTATGARVSELIQFKVEHLRLGYMDLYSKGGKCRRIYLPQTLTEEALEWLDTRKVTSGFIFLKKNGKQITPRGINSQLKKLASDYHLDPSAIYPHSFRHRFAKNFLERFNDISLLADLMGHESIETTRIYLKRSSVEQRQFIDEVIIW